MTEGSRIRLSADPRVRQAAVLRIGRRKHDAGSSHWPCLATGEAVDKRLWLAVVQLREDLGVPVSEHALIATALANTLSAVSGAFAKNELAYLALTSKAELPIRDRVAWDLQLALGETYVVSREWRRADIAVLREDLPLVQVEAKALYAFDVLSAKSRANYLAKLTSDGLKMAGLVPGGTAFLLALITQVDGAMPAHLGRHVVKYSNWIRAALASEGGNAELVAARARQLWEADLAQLKSPWQRFPIEGGQQWGLRVDIDAYLVGPLIST